MAGSDGVRALETDLRRAVDGEVRFDAGSRALYATDGSNYRQVPIGVVIPRSIDDVIATVETCRAHGAPVLSRGAGTSLAGQCCNVAVVIDFSKYLDRVLEVDPARGLARVQPGVVLDVLRGAAGTHGLTFGPDPSTHSYCTMGGMVGNNSCGVHSIMAGRTAENVEALDVLTYDGVRVTVGGTSDADLADIAGRGGRRGEIYTALRALRDRYGDEVRERYPNIPRRVSGYNLDELLPERGFDVARALVGTEGTCVTVLGATVRLVPDPPGRALLVLGYPDVYAAADDAPEVLEAHPIGLEGFDDLLIDKTKKKGLHPDAVALLPEGGGWLLAEFGGTDRAEADSQARALMRRLRRRPAAPAMELFDDPAQARKIWEVRESGLGVTARVPGEPDAWEGWEDSAVPPARLGEYLRDLRKLLELYGYAGAFYGHFGDGCLHTRITFDVLTPEGTERFRSFVGDAADLVVSYGGSLSGEHGDGQSRAELLPKMFGERLVGAFREFKTIWDPQGAMNPGKVVDAYPLAANFRVGTGYRPAHPRTHFRFPDDDGSLARATTRCVGVGKCRRDAGGVMCPSYMVTREEKHSTRGRAHLLHEMLTGDVVRGRWRDESVREALDLCLACKGCKSECPVNVDVATYKAEFLSHYYEGRLRPRPAYFMGLIYWWSRLAARTPKLANALVGSAAASALLKRVAGLAPRRDLPRFAEQTFTTWFRERRRPHDGERGRVILWPDTFTNHFEPEVARAAVRVLEHAGYEVVLPPRILCCGRPLYDYGMLDLARRQLRQILSVLRSEIARGTPVVGLEPSCVAVFRDELPNLLAEDEDATRLRDQTFTLAEFLVNEARIEPPPLSRRALVQRHCHQASVLGFTADRELLGRMGVDTEILDSGCCGMAGSFGFEREKYEVSIKAGERVLLPAVRDASTDTLVLADGFSCREQIRQTTGRRSMHLAQVIEMALDNGWKE